MEERRLGLATDAAVSDVVLTLHERPSDEKR